MIKEYYTKAEIRQILEKMSKDIDKKNEQEQSNMKLFVMLFVVTFQITFALLQK